MDADKERHKTFLINSLIRSKVSICKDVYEFVDSMVNCGWVPPYGTIFEVDLKVQEKYLEFINGQK